MKKTIIAGLSALVMGASGCQLGQAIMNNGDTGPAPQVIIRLQDDVSIYKLQNQCDELLEKAKSQAKASGDTNAYNRFHDKGWCTYDREKLGDDIRFLREYLKNSP